MALLEPQVGVGSVTGAHRTGDDHRLTGSMEITLPGTSSTGCCYVHGAPIRYVASDGNEYTDTVAPETAAIVWTPDPTPPTDPHHIGDLAYTLAAGATTFDNRSARWKIFAPALYGGATYLLAARSCDFGDATSALAAILASTAGTANTAGDILILEYVNSPGQVRRLQHGCSACGSGASNITLQLIAGTPPLNTSTPKVPQRPTTVPLDGIDAPTSQLFQPFGLLKDVANKLLYIACGQGVRVVDATGIIETVLGTNDLVHPGTDTASDPLSHRVRNGTAVQLDADGTLIAASDQGEVNPTFGSTTPFYQVDARDSNHCLVNIHGFADDATQFHQGLIRVTTPGQPGAGASVQADYFTVATWTNANPPGGLYPFSEAFTTGLAITRTGRLLQAYSAIHNWLYVTGDSNPFHNFGQLGRITDRSATPNVDLLWAYNEYTDAISPPVCAGNNGFDLRNPQGICLSADESLLYIAAAGNHCVLSLNLTTNEVLVVAGTLNSAGFAGDGGLATSAKLAGPSGVCLASDGSLIVADTNNHCIRRFPIGGTITTICGVPGQSGCSQWSAGTLAVVPDTELHLGPAKTTLLSGPRSVAALPGCGVLIADTNNFRVLLLSCARSKN